MRADSPERLSLARLAAFSSPMIVVQLIEVAWRVYLPGYFSATAGLSLGVVGALLMAARLFDSVIDPAIAWASDRFPTRYGHRRPWLVASLPLMMLGALGVFFPWPWMTPGGLVAACLLLHLGYMMFVTPHGGWALELARDPDERLRVMAAKTWFAIAGIIGVLLLPAALERGFAVGREGQVAMLGAALLLLGPLSVFLVVRHVPEPALPKTRAAELANPLRLFANIVREPALRPILLLYLLSGLAESAGGAAFFFFIDRALKLEGWGSTLLLIQYGAVLITLPLWSKFGARMGRRPMLMLAYGWQVVVAPVALFLPVGGMAPMIGFLLLRSLLAGVDFMLLRAMVADVARDAAATGLRHGASCYSVSNITLKLAMGAGAWFALSAIGAAETGVAERETVVRAIYALTPATAGLLGLLVLGFGFAPTARPSPRPPRADGLLSPG